MSQPFSGLSSQPVLLTLQPEDGPRAIALTTGEFEGRPLPRSNLRLSLGIHGLIKSIEGFDALKIDDSSDCHARILPSR